MKGEVQKMATSSITKEFVVKDTEAFEKLLKKVEQMPERKVSATQSPSLAKGREALKKFSYR